MFWHRFVYACAYAYVASKNQPKVLINILVCESICTCFYRTWRECPTTCYHAQPATGTISKRFVLRVYKRTAACCRTLVFPSGIHFLLLWRLPVPTFLGRERNLGRNRSAQTLRLTRPGQTVLPSQANLSQGTKIKTCIGGWPDGTAKSSQLARNLLNCLTTTAQSPNNNKQLCCRKLAGGGQAVENVAQVGLKFELDQIQANSSQ